MKLLLDTHAFIWWDSEPEKLSARSRACCQDTTNELFLSVASVWEMQIKQQLGKLKLNSPLAEIVANQQKTNGIEITSVNLAHVLALDTLPTHHKDPFDRLLIAQAVVERITLITNDRIFSQYAVETLW